MIPHLNLILSFLRRRLGILGPPGLFWSVSGPCPVRGSLMQTFANGLGKKVLQHINYISRGVERFAREETLKVNLTPQDTLVMGKIDYLNFRMNGTGLQRCLSEYFSSFLLFLVPQQLYYLRGDEKKPQVLKML